MASKQLELPIFHYDDPATGSPLVGGLVYTYAAGTSTALTTYTDSTLGTANSNPVVLDAYGNAKIWYDQSLKVIVRSADALTTYFTEDNISPVGGTTTTFGEYNLVQNGSFEADTSGTPDNWTIAAYSGSTIAVSTTIQKHGTQSLRFNTTGAATGGGTATTGTFSVNKSSLLQLSFSYYATHATTTNVVQIFWYQYDGTASATASTTVHTLAAANPTSWTNYNYSVTIPSDATQATLKITGIDSGGSNLTASAYFDDIVLVPLYTFTATGTTLTEPVLTDPVLNGTLSGTAFLDDDTMAADSATAVVSQQSLVAYLAAQIAAATAFRGALVYHSAGYTIPTSTYSHLQFDSESYDTDTIHDTVTNNKRLTVPAGVTRIKLFGRVNFAGNATGTRIISFSKNDETTIPTGVVGLPYDERTPTASSLYMHLASPTIDVVAGDYFTLMAYQSSGGDLLILDNLGGFYTYFVMEIVA